MSSWLSPPQGNCHDIYSFYQQQLVFIHMLVHGGFGGNKNFRDSFVRQLFCVMVVVMLVEIRSSKLMLVQMLMLYQALVKREFPLVLSYD